MRKCNHTYLLQEESIFPQTVRFSKQLLVWLVKLSFVGVSDYTQILPGAIAAKLGNPKRLKCLKPGEIALMPHDVTSYVDTNVRFKWTYRYFDGRSNPTINIDLDADENDGRLTIDPHTG